MFRVLGLRDGRVEGPVRGVQGLVLSGFRVSGV